MQFEKDYEIYEFLCKKNELKYDNILNLFLDCSDQHSIKKNFYLEELMETGYTWIIHSWQISINKLPKSFEKVRIKTWIDNFTKISIFRKFEMVDNDNKVIISGDCEFVILNLKNKKISRIPSKIIEKINLIPNSKNKIERFNVEGEEFSEKTIYIQRDDIDMNNHVHNTVYLKWLIESIPNEFYENYDLKEFIIIFNKEVRNVDRISTINYKKEKYIYSNIKTDEINAKIKSHWRLKKDEA